MRQDGAACPGCGLPNYSGLCPHCRGDRDAYERELVPPFPTTRQEEPSGDRIARPGCSPVAWIIHYSDQDAVVTSAREAEDRAACGILVTPLVPAKGEVGHFLSQLRALCGSMKDDLESSQGAPAGNAWASFDAHWRGLDRILSEFEKG